MRTFFLAAAALASAAGAQTASPFDDNALRAFVSQQVAASVPHATRFDVQLGLVQHGALAPCRRTEPFLGAGARLWGRSSLGVRCVDGANWSVLMPVTVRAWGPALVASSPVAAGSEVGAGDVTEQEVELTREPPGLLRELAQVAGKQLVRNVNPGQALRAEMFRTPQAVQAGDPVRLRLGGGGFQVTATGRALGSAAEGQSVRGRTEFGKVLTGTAREGRIVDVAL